MPCISTCCYCFSTYQGSMIIGVFTLLPSISGVGLLSHLLNTWETNGGSVASWAQNVTTYMESSSAKLPFVSNFVTSATADLHTVCVVLLIYLVGATLTALMLIGGVYQGMRCMILPWLTMVLLRLLAVGVCVGLYFYVASSIPDSKIKEHFILYGLIMIPEIVLTMYGWLCVFSHYHHLQLLEQQVYPIGEEEPVMVLTPVDSDKY